MSVPGFRAEATIYRSTIAYQSVWGRAVTSGSDADPVRPTRSADGRICEPNCTSCVSTVDSPTGCIMRCLTLDCEEGYVPCRGCASPCNGGQFCNGLCTDTNTSPFNCGACGNQCPAGVGCVNGVCGCSPGYTNCPSGCKDTSSDPSNCGTCGNVCSCQQICQNGACVAAPNCPVFCSLWNYCNQTCGEWPPGITSAGCWESCLQVPISCLNSLCASGS